MTSASRAGIGLPRTAQSLCGCLGLMALLSAGNLPRQAVELVGPRFTLLSVADSGQYLRYEYEVLNPARSTASIGTLVIEHYASGSSARTSPDAGPPANVVRFPASFIPMTATTAREWTDRGFTRAMVVRPPVDGFSEVDSIPPGHALNVVIRSPFLPGVRPVGASPIHRVCCTQRDTLNPDQGYPLPWDAPVTSLGVLPTVPPAALTADLLDAQLAALCRRGGWLEGDSSCTYVQRLESEENVDRFVDQIRSSAADATGMAAEALLLLEVNARVLSGGGGR